MATPAPLDRLLFRARERMRAAFLLERIFLHLAVAAGVWLALLLLDKSGLWVLADWRTGALPSPHAELLPALLGIALLTAWLRLRAEAFTPARVAAALDIHLGSQERLLSAATLGGSGLPLAGPLVEDALRAAAPLRLSQAAPLRAGRAGRWLALLAPAALAFALLVPAGDWRGERKRRAEEVAQAQRERTEVAVIVRDLRREAKKLDEGARRPPVDPKALEELKKRMERLASEIEKDSTLDPRKAQEKINRLQDELREQARRALAAEESLAGLRSRDRRSLTKELTDRLREGDGKKAAEAMRRMRRELRKNMSKEELERLEKEARELAKELKDGGLESLAKSLDDLASELRDLQNSAKDEKLRQLREKLADALEDLKGESLDLSKLTEEERELLRQLQQALSQMEKTEQELERMAEAARDGRMRRLTAEDLKRMLENLRNKKNDSCPGGGKDGEGSCGLTAIPMPGGQGSGQCSGQGSGSGQGAGPGTGGSGRGAGGRPPERESSSGMVDQRLRARQILEGRILGGWDERGLPPSDERSKGEYVEALREAERSEDSARERESVPREERDLVREYNERIRE